MKISNSKKQLAQIIHENGGWRDGAKWVTSDRDGFLSFFAGAARPTRDGDSWSDHGDCEYTCGRHAPRGCVTNWHQTILSRDEYFYLYPSFEKVMLPAELENSNTGKLTVLAADYRNAKDYAGRKQQEADAAKADADAKLAAYVAAAGSAVGLVLSVALVEPELMITNWRDLQVGDEISVQHLKNVYSKSAVLAVGDSEVGIRNHAGARKSVNLDAVNWKFIRRPAKGDANA